LPISLKIKEIGFSFKRQEEPLLFSGLRMWAFSKNNFSARHFKTDGGIFYGERR